MEYVNYFQYIALDFFPAYGMYSLLYLIISTFYQNPVVEETDRCAIGLMRFIGFVYGVVWLIGIIDYYNGPEPGYKLIPIAFWSLLWIAIWIQPLLWIAITQLLCVSKANSNGLLRTILSVLLMVPLDRFLSFFANFWQNDRDYLPSSWTMYTDLGIYPSNVFLAVATKIILLLLLTGLYAIIENQIKKRLKRTASLQN